MTGRDQPSTFWSYTMHYEVSYQVGGEQRVEHVDANDAASAAQRVQELHGHGDGLFELISIHLMDELPADHHSTVPGSQLGSPSHSPQS